MMKEVESKCFAPLFFWDYLLHFVKNYLVPKKKKEEEEEKSAMYHFYILYRS
jgi:hypothetical protein